MTSKVGIVRNSRELGEALFTVRATHLDLEKQTVTTMETLETRNLVVVAELIVRSALMRKESRGLHATTDYPEKDERENHDTVLVKTK